MDVLSEVLRVVKLNGAVFYKAEFSSPWSFRSPPSRILVPYLASPPGHVIIFHLLTEGRGFAQLSEVGYDSEPAFNRTFKREFGLPPARFRSQSKSGRSTIVRRALMDSRHSAKR